LSSLAGSIDYTDQAALAALYNEVNTLKLRHLEHAGSEEKYIHPILAQRVPGSTKKMEGDHREQERQLEELISHLEGMSSNSTEPGKRIELGLEFYRALNRFISSYLAHIDYEEEHVQPTLWAMFSNEELLGMMKSILSNQSPEQGMWWLSTMLPAMNMTERVALLSPAKNMIPPDVFKSMLDSISKLFTQEEWAVLKSRIGI
jgi:hypothetical protein